MSNISWYLNKPYRIGTGNLQIGDKVLVHPTERSISREPFEAKIILEKINWVRQGPCDELCTHVENGYSPVINDYLFDRLELIQKAQ